MNQFGPLIALICVAAVLLAALGGMVAWYNEEGRRIRRGLRRVLKGETHALIIAYGRGRGAGFNFFSSTMAVTWDTGAWCLIYKIDELLGAELIIDNQVAGRSFRGEPRRPVDVIGGAEKQVVLRLVFDDPQHADFPLELWTAGRRIRKGELTADEAAEEGNRWLARMESVFRRQPSTARTRAAHKAAAAAPEAPAPDAPPPPPAEPAPPPEPAKPAKSADKARQELPFDPDNEDEN